MELACTQGDAATSCIIKKSVLDIDVTGDDYLGGQKFILRFVSGSTNLERKLAEVFPKQEVLFRSQSSGKVGECLVVKLPRLFDATAHRSNKLATATMSREPPQYS